MFILITFNTKTEVCNCQIYNYFIIINYISLRILTNSSLLVAILLEIKITKNTLTKTILEVSMLVVYKQLSDYHHRGRWLTDLQTLTRSLNTSQQLFDHVTVLCCTLGNVRIAFSQHRYIDDNNSWLNKLVGFTS